MLNTLEEILLKKFEYDYGNKFKKILNDIIIFITNLGLFMFIIFILLIMLGIIFNMVIEFKFVNYIVLIIFIFSSIYLIFKFLLVTFTKKEVVLYESYLKIKKGFIDIFPFGFNHSIQYNNIVSCEYYSEKKTFFYDGKSYAILFFNYNSLVRIVDEKNHEYYIPLKESKEFICEVNERIKSSKENNE